MNVTRLAIEAAKMRGWPHRIDYDTTAHIEVALDGGRTQLVNLTVAQDGDGDVATFLWSLAAATDAGLDPWKLLAQNMNLTYGRVAVSGTEIRIVYALNDDHATIVEVGKAIYWVARAADELEAQTYGTDTL
ncbi:MAG: hypothetical protein ACI9OJ_003654 [Myxococcota bacterium]|jgi:hypothetical protein